MEKKYKPKRISIKDDLRTIAVRFLVSEKERVELIENAKQSGESNLSEFIRKRVLG